MIDTIEFPIPSDPSVFNISESDIEQLAEICDENFRVNADGTITYTDNANTPTAGEPLVRPTRSNPGKAKTKKTRRKLTNQFTSTETKILKESYNALFKKNQVKATLESVKTAVSSTSESVINKLAFLKEKKLTPCPITIKDEQKQKAFCMALSHIKKLHTNRVDAKKYRAARNHQIQTLQTEVQSLQQEIETHEKKSKKLQNENTALRKEVDELKHNQQSIQHRADEMHEGLCRLVQYCTFINQSFQVEIPPVVQEAAQMIDCDLPTIEQPSITAANQDIAEARPFFEQTVREAQEQNLPLLLDSLNSSPK